MRPAAVISLLFVCALLLLSSCSRRFNSFYVGNNGRYVVRKHGPAFHLFSRRKYYGHRVRIRDY